MARRTDDPAVIDFRHNKYLVLRSFGIGMIGS